MSNPNKIIGMYSWSQDDLKRTIHTELFKHGVSLCLEYASIGTHKTDLDTWYQKDKYDMVKTIHDLPLHNKYKYVYDNNIPLSFMIRSENPNLFIDKFYPSNNGDEPISMYNDVKEDFDVMKDIQNKSTHIHTLEWWTYLHMCQCQAVFIMYPIMKLLYPKMPIYLYSNGNHVVLSNTHFKDINKETNFTGNKTYSRNIDNDIIIFDMIGQVMDLDLKFSLSHYELMECIEESNIPEWYSRNYGWNEIDDMSIYHFYSTFANKI
jgi:hypothetical protein